jgi:hypothetical protein
MDGLIFKVMGCYFLILVVFGTFSNLLGLYVCVRRRLYVNTTFVFVAFIFVADILTLYIWCLNHFLEAFFDFSVESLNVWACRFGFFLQQFTLEWSSWLLVISVFK